MSPSPGDTDQDGVSDVVERRQGSDPLTHGLFPGSYPHIPEPMVFDLVRGLGATKGEFEFNTLVMSRFEPYEGISWAPEIEWAFADRHALEFELPMHDAGIEALKLAVQGTVAERKPRFIHGWQLMGEYVVAPKVAETTALYLAGLRVGKRVSLFGMIGPRASFGQQAFHTELLLNPSIFVDVHETATIGLETNATIDGRASRVRIVPQAHVQLGRHFRLQFGGGTEVSHHGVTPVAALRGVIE